VYKIGVKNWCKKMFVRVRWLISFYLTQIFGVKKIGGTKSKNFGVKKLGQQLA